MSNFLFLKNIDKNLFEIISDAESLYRDEYFEQCMTQTRRFAEVITKNILQNESELSFDEMLSCLKDKSTGKIQEKELLEDLYFLKQNGNKSAHSGKVKQDGITALECLKRAFEISINYVILKKECDKNILNLDFDINLLITGKKSNKKMVEIYSENQDKISYETKTIKKTLKKTKISKNQKQKKIKQKQKQKQEMSLFKKIFFGLIFSVIISLICLFWKIFPELFLWR